MFILRRRRRSPLHTLLAIVVTIILLAVIYAKVVRSGMIGEVRDDTSTPSDQTP